MSSNEGEELDGDMFREPDDYFEPEKPASYTELTLRSGQKLRLRLVGHNPLWVPAHMFYIFCPFVNVSRLQGHVLWNGGRILSTYLQQHASRLVHGKTLLELGAGAGLPSLVAAILGARKVVVTDYPDVELIDNLVYNIGTCKLLPQPATNIAAAGYLWGSSVKSLQSHLTVPSQGFDTLLLADLLFNHYCHDALVSTIREALAPRPDARALVFFTPYRPWLLEKDMAFFDLCRERGLVVQKVMEEVLDKVLFENDKGNELLRRTIFGYELRWKIL